MRTRLLLIALGSIAALVMFGYLLRQLSMVSVGLAAKGCVVFSREPLYEYRDYATKVDEELSTLAWLYHMNHGIFMTPGVEEEWTLSVAHEQEHIDRYVAAFEAFASDVSSS